ncbi:hypothetical protein [Sagittula sp. NFXS13]|uniref:hypothetical protein n=1 Tax=Sagittula sp. NFXS13 TaxID=2819095 RepID=UPI0032E0383B
MYGLTFDALRRSWPVMGVIVALLVVGDRFIDGLAPQIALLIVYGVAAFSTHRCVLLHDRVTWGGVQSSTGGGVTDLPLFAFLWRFVLISAAGLALAFFPIFWLTYFGRFYLSSNPEVNVIGMTLLGTAVGLPFSLLLLTFVGTLLPAAAIGGDARIGSALRRGRVRFWKTIGRFFAGPGVVFLLVTLVMGKSAMNPTITMAGDITLHLIGAALGVFCTMMVATILSMTYREAEATAPS